MTSADLARAVRAHVLRMTSSGRSSHVGSALSCADLLAVLYADVLQADPEHPDWPDRDRVIMSKGHAGAALYAVLAERGFFDTAVLHRHYQNGSYLSGHVSHVGIPGVEFSTGSLGHGLPVGAGLAWRARQTGRSWRTYVLLGDGECDEGSVWEAAMFAGHHELASLVAIVDYNRMQSLGTTDETLTLEPFAAKWRAFGWDVAEVDGHDHAALVTALRVPRTAEPGRPRCVLAHTVKGKGVSFMENRVLWHYRHASAEELERALAEVGA
ncbi:transketolase [Actinoplanes sp. NPDC023714]|uniref:transketolase n=1 Tax=Actinoplanes sp. NPDC023714 TaxID=3154322 RepID=UPI00340AF22B